MVKRLQIFQPIQGVCIQDFELFKHSSSPADCQKNDQSFKKKNGLKN